MKTSRRSLPLDKPAVIPDGTRKQNLVTLLLPAVLAVVYFLVMLVLYLYVPSVVKEPQPLGMGAASATGMMIVGLGGLTAWGVTAYYRCSDGAIRRYLVISTALMVAWMTLVLVKYPAQSPHFIEGAWYLFYVPMVMLPTLVFFGGLRTSNFQVRPSAHLIKRAVLGASLALILLVLTNPLHQLVFVFDRADPNFSSNYTYGPGYWPVFAWTWVMLGTAGLMLSQAARTRLRFAAVVVSVLIVSGLVYAILYIVRVQYVFTSNLTFTYVLVAVLVTEASFWLGLIPSYAWNRDAFVALPLDLWVLTLDGDQVFKTDVADGLTPEVTKEFARSSVRSGGVRQLILPEFSNTIYTIYDLAGGIAVLASDVSEVNHRRRLLVAKQTELQKNHLLLEQNWAVQKSLRRLQQEKQLLRKVEDSLSHATGRIRVLLAALPEGDNEQGLQQRRKQLLVVKLLVAYSKAKGALVLAEHEDTDFDRERLQLLFSQSAADFRASGMPCAFTAEVSTQLPTWTASVLYDVFYDFALSSLKSPDSALLVHLSEQGDRQVELRIARASSGRNEDAYVVPQEIHNNLTQFNAKHTVERSPGLLLLKVTAPIGGSER